MKYLLSTLLQLITCSFLFGQQNHYWQQEVNYTINVSLNDSSKSLNGNISIHYTNHSADTLTFIWFHLWPNAYKNDLSAFSDQLLENGRTDFYFSDDDQKGYINQLNFEVDNKLADIELHPKYQDVVKLILPSPLFPGFSTTITTPFHVKLPFNFSRGGYVNDTYQVTQWYPKPAVYDQQGWHEMPYLDQGEFYSEYGTFDVHIQAPSKYIIAATGELIDSSSLHNEKKYHYIQSNVHDFAWFADKNFIVSTDTLSIDSSIITVNAYYHLNNSSTWKNSLTYLKNAIITKSKWIGAYPYKTVSIVESMQKNIGGMEYPTITLIENSTNSNSLEELINHEVGHNWFYGILGTNERLHPWMDEGMNTYYDYRYSLLKNKKSDFFSDQAIRNIFTSNICKIKKDQPIETSADQFTAYNYEAIAYNKSAQWMQQLENKMGQSTFDSMMHTYFETWKFKHPQPTDFKTIATSFNQTINNHFMLLSQKGSIDDNTNKKIKLGLGFNNSDMYNHINFSPALGYNTHDKIMFGAILHNYALVNHHFQFVAVPLYSNTTKKLNGIGRVSYNYYPGNDGQNFEFSLSAASFSTDQYTKETEEETHYLGFTKLVPSVKYNFASSQERSSVNTSVEWKCFFINDHQLLDDQGTTSNRYLNQFAFNIENERVLYPYHINFLIEQAKQFLKFNLTSEHFFNYAKGGGLSCRFFAGKFMYTSQAPYVNFETERYHFNMSGASGNQDYTYSHYFLGRNDEDGIGSQQLRIKDGGLKLNINNDILSDKIGVTDDWLMAINFSSTIPDKINFLRVLPFKIPMKIFADFGTYADAWKVNSSSEKILYDAGIQFSFLGNVLNIYVPLFYSNTYKNYFDLYVQENQFMKNISFSIDLQNIKIKNLFTKMSF